MKRFFIEFDLKYILVNYVMENSKCQRKSITVEKIITLFKPCLNILRLDNFHCLDPNKRIHFV